MGDLTDAERDARRASAGCVGIDLWTPWHDRIHAEMPPAHEVRRRNAAVTSRYAGYYKARPDLFKWAGVAAFASHRVGLALTPYRPIERLEDAIGALHHGHRPELEPDIEVLRETNNQVFHDMSWAHEAFVSDGFAAVDHALKDRPEYVLMLDGFRHLDEASRLLAGSSSEQRRGQELVWNGSQLLLKQEQFVTVQPHFDQIKPHFRKFLSVATAMDFDADNWMFDWLTHTSFPLFMYVRGVPMLVRTRSWPNIALRDHRWLWASKSILTIWRRVDRWDRKLGGRIDRLISGRAVFPS